MSDDDAGVTVTVTVDGTDEGYVPVVHIGEDLSIALDGRAPSYALAVVTAAERAAYDSALIRQLTRMNLAAYEIAAEVLSLRARRGEVDDDATAPLRFRGEVAADTAPIVRMLQGSDELGTFSYTQACAHAHAVLTVASVADLDNDYFEHITKGSDVEAGMARTLLYDLSTYRADMSAHSRLTRALLCVGAPDDLIARVKADGYVGRANDLIEELRTLGASLLAARVADGDFWGVT